MKVFALADKVEGEERHVEEKRRDNLERHIIDLVRDLVKHKIEKHKDERISPCGTCYSHSSYCRYCTSLKVTNMVANFVCVKAVKRLSMLESESVH